MKKILDKDVVEAPAIDDAKLKHLSPQPRNSVRYILHKLPSLSDDKIGETNTTEHNIDVIQNTKLFFSHPYRAGRKQRAVV